MPKSNEPDMDEMTTMLILRFTEFQALYGNAREDQQRAFLDYIAPQSRNDILALAAAIKEKDAQPRTS